MLRANFFDKFFKYKNNNNNNIVKFNSNEKFSLQNQLNTQIIEIDKEISENTKDLIQAQIVKLRSTFSKSHSFIEKIGKNAYKVKLEDTINWHQKQLKELYFRRREVQNNLEKIQGIFWLNRLKRYLIIILLLFLSLLALFIFISGFMIIIYLLPLIIFIFLGYWLVKQKY